MLKGFIAGVVAIYMAIIGVFNTPNDPPITALTVATSSEKMTQVATSANSLLVIKQAKLKEVPQTTSDKHAVGGYYQNKKTGEIISKEQFAALVSQDNSQINQKSSTESVPQMPESMPTPKPKGILCNNKYWTSCPLGQELVCPTSGDAYCIAENVSNAGKKRKITTIKINVDTKSRLEHLKVYSRETYDDILKKMLEILNACRANPEQARARLISLDKERKHNFKEEK